MAKRLLVLLRKVAAVQALPEAVAGVWPGVAITQHHLDHAKPVDNHYRHLKTTFSAVCKRRSGEVQRA